MKKVVLITGACRRKQRRNRRTTGPGYRKAALIGGVPMKRMGLPEEVAQAIVFLGSDKSPFLTGQIIAVDGGKLA